MDRRLLHIFRNRPLGRETLLQSIYFCKKVGAGLVVYIPEFEKFLMYFKYDVVQIDLDRSYLTSPETAEEHVRQIAEAEGVEVEFLKPRTYTASTLPSLSVDFDFMCCPRSISDLSSKIGLGYIGTKVRRIVTAARFPVLITTSVYKPWNSVTAFFGGSKNARNALKLGIEISKISGVPIDVFTQNERHDRAHYEKALKNDGSGVEENLRNWLFFENGKLEENLFAVPHDSLAVLGAYGHGVMKDVLFGSKLEKIQRTLPNSFLIVGPNCKVTES